MAVLKSNYTDWDDYQSNLRNTYKFSIFYNFPFQTTACYSELTSAGLEQRPQHTFKPCKMHTFHNISPIIWRYYLLLLIHWYALYNLHATDCYFLCKWWRQTVTNQHSLCGHKRLTFLCHRATVMALYEHVRKIFIPIHQWIWLMWFI